MLDCASFPEDHPLFCGPLGMSVKTISDRLAGHDLAVVIGAEAFQYYPYVPGDYLPAGTGLLQITANPEVAAAARVGDSLLGDPKLAIDLLLDLVAKGSARTAPEPMPRPRLLPQVPNSPPFFATARGGIGWGVPAAVGVALGDRDRGVSRPVVGLIGDGSFQYSVQALWTAAQHQLPIVYVVMRNNEYSILKSFAVLEDTPGVPGLDLPGLGIASVARGFGCRAVDVGTAEELEHEFKTALSAGTTTVIVGSTQPRKAML
jgi:benzoylformate decarboxylase